MPLLKNHTKFKIIKWVERVLRYQPEPIKLMSEKQRTIEILKWERVIRHEDVRNGSYEAAMALDIAKGLQELNVIETRIMEELVDFPYPGEPYRRVRIQARLNYVTPEKN